MFFVYLAVLVSALPTVLAVPELVELSLLVCLNLLLELPPLCGDLPPQTVILHILIQEVMVTAYHQLQAMPGVPPTLCQTVSV